MKSKVLEALQRQNKGFKSIAMTAGRNESNVRKQITGVIALTPEIAWHVQKAGLDLGEMFLDEPSGKLDVDQVIDLTAQYNANVGKEIKGTNTDTYAVKIPKVEGTEFFGEAHTYYKMLVDPSASMADFILEAVRQYKRKLDTMK